VSPTGKKGGKKSRRVPSNLAEREKKGKRREAVFARPALPFSKKMQGREKGIEKSADRRELVPEGEKKKEGDGFTSTNFQGRK